MKDFINKIISFFGKFQSDKILHAYGSTLICVLTFMMMSMFCNPTVSIGFAFIFTLFIGFCKEYFIDYKMRNTQYSNDDMMADFIGILIGTIINLFIIFMH